MTDRGIKTNPGCSISKQLLEYEAESPGQILTVDMGPATNVVPVFVQLTKNLWAKFESGRTSWGETTLQYVTTGEGPRGNS